MELRFVFVTTNYVHSLGVIVEVWKNFKLGLIMRIFA